MERIQLLEEGALCAMDFEVLTFDCTAERTISPSALLRYVEEVADHHLTAYQLSISQMLELETVFLLTGLSLRFVRHPALRERLTAVTWQRAIRGAQFIRDTEILDVHGERVAECTANWVLVDAKTHKIKRPREFPQHQRIPSLPDRALHADGNILIRMPSDLTVVDCRKIRYSELDYNQHLNNTRYADLVMDYAAEGTQSRQFRRLRITFSGEALLDDEVEIARSDWTKDGMRYVKGTHSRGRCFEAACSLWE